MAITETEIFSIKIFPILEICQLPTLNIDNPEFFPNIYLKNYNYKRSYSINKEFIEELFLLYNFKNLILLKHLVKKGPYDPNDFYMYTYCDLYITDLFKILNEIKRLNNLKVFW